MTTSSVPSPPSEPPAPASSTAPPTGLRHRVLGMRAVLAVALASVVLGGVGGVALGAVANGADEQQGPGGGPGGMPFPMQQGQQGLTGGGPQGFDPQRMPGQLPPGTAPQDDVVPDDSGVTSGGTGDTNT